VLHAVGLSAARVETILLRKIGEINQRICDLQTLRDDLTGRLAEVCPLIASGT